MKNKVFIDFSLYMAFGCKLYKASLKERTKQIIQTSPLATCKRKYSTDAVRLQVSRQKVHLHTSKTKL